MHIPSTVKFAPENRLDLRRAVSALAVSGCLASSYDSAFYQRADCNVDELDRLLKHERASSSPSDYPLASEMIAGVVVYNDTCFQDPSNHKRLQNEIAHAFLDGPGIVVLRGAFSNDVIDRTNAAFDKILAQEKTEKMGDKGDHFSKPGANSRIWNTAEKLAVFYPDVFLDYFCNEVIPLVSLSWLGPNYQVTAQVNIVHPGCEAQLPHRDYHLGFMSTQEAERYPAIAHRLSAALTLQGAVAHVDMDLSSGPTLYLPHSHKYKQGYLVRDLKEFKQYFDDNHIQIPLKKGDAVFFNPSVLHAAGRNWSGDVDRVANLLQISSAFGRAMETVDRTRVSQALYPLLLARQGRADWSDKQTANVVAAASEGYAFPTNLDRDQPIDGIAPETQAQLVHKALREKWSLSTFLKALEDHTRRRQTV